MGIKECPRGLTGAPFSLLAVVPLLLLATPVFAGPVTVPGTLPPGSQYRLAFVTSDSTTASSTDITTYDAFVQAAADAVPELNALGTTWQVIGSTATVDAITHTGTGTGPGSTVPIYNFDAQLLANNGPDLWDGELNDGLAFDETGARAGGEVVWTGTLSDGYGWSPEVLGALGGFTLYGVSGFRSEAWTDVNAAANGQFSLHLYAISAPLTVPVPDPSTGVLLTFGFGAILLLRGMRPK